MRNHYVTKHYLRAWTPEPERIYWLDKSAQDPVPKLVGVNDAGVEQCLYADDIERDFNREVEQPAQPLIDRLRASETLKRAEMMPLVRYMLCQIVRTPRYLDFLTEQSVSEVRVILDALAGLGVDISEHGYGEGLIDSKIREGFGRHREILAAKPSRNWSNQLFWTVVKLGPVGEFITGDNPVFTWSSDHNGVPRVLLFPLSPKLTLIGSQRHRIEFRSLAVVTNGDTINVAYKKVNDRFSQYINDTIAENARRFLYGRSYGPLVAALRPNH